MSEQRERYEALPPIRTERAVAYGMDPQGDARVLRLDEAGRVLAHDPVAREALALIVRFLFGETPRVTDEQITALLGRLEPR